MDKISESNPLKSLFQRLKIKDVMTYQYNFVYDDQDLSIAVGKFLNNPISHLIVLDRKDKLAGLLTPKYIYKAHSPKRIINDTVEISRDVMIDGDAFYDRNALNNYILRSIMKKDPFTLHQEDSLSEAISNMKRGNLSCIPIIDSQKKVLGLISSNDIVDFLSNVIK